MGVAVKVKTGTEPVLIVNASGMMYVTDKKVDYWQIDISHRKIDL